MSALEAARRIAPDFPTSAGRPFRTPDEQLLGRRDEFARAARELPPEAATELAARTWRLWMAARDVAGGRAFLAEVLDRREPQESRWRVLALYGDGLFAFWNEDPEGARRRNEEALELAQRLGDAESLLFAQLGLSRVEVEAGNAVRAAELARAARALAAALGEATEQATIHMQAQAARLGGDYDAAAARFEESLALNRRIDDASMIPVELHNLTLVEVHRGNAEAAARYLAELPPATEPYVADLLRVAQAGIAFRRGDVQGAQDLLGAVDADAFASEDRDEFAWLREQLECAAT